MANRILWDKALAERELLRGRSRKFFDPTMDRDDHDIGAGLSVARIGAGDIHVA